MDHNNYQCLDKWRNFFKTSNENIFDIIQNGILIAAKYYPQDLRAKREKIVESLFLCTLAESPDPDQVKLFGESEEGCKNGVERQYSNHTVEALSDELEEEHRIVCEILKIKMILENTNEESESVLLDSLKQLQLMDISVDNLDATKIGKTVNLMRKHRSKNISILSKEMIVSWKSMVNDRLCVTKKTIAGAADTSESTKPPCTEEEEKGGLPSPPLDEGAFFLSHTTSFDLGKFFDGMDDDGNLRHEPHDNSEIARSKNKSNDDLRKHGPNMRKHAKERFDRKESNGTKRKEKIVQESIQKQPLALDKEELKSTDNATNLEARKTNLHEGYQQIQNVKKQRTIQVIDLCDIPK